MMERLSRLTLLFAVAYAVFIVLPAFLSMQFPPYPLIKVGDMFDLLTPLALIPLYWLLYQVRPDRLPDGRESILFLLAAAIWCTGQGMHLSANAIGHLLDTLKTTDAYAGTHFFDEVLSHYEWHLGGVALATLLLWRQWRLPFAGERTPLTVEAGAALIYGFVTFIATVEAGTVPLGLPFALIVAAFGLTRARPQWRAQPVLAFFTFAYTLASILLLGWGLYWQGFPQFSDLGWIK